MNLTVMWSNNVPGDSPNSADIVEGPYPTVMTQTSGRQVPVVTAKSYGKYLGKIQLDFDDEGEVISWTGSPILLDSSIAEGKLLF